MSLASIAKAAGVSTATVSRVINDRPGVSKEKAAAIRALIKKMSLEPMQLRRQARSTRRWDSLAGKTVAWVQERGGYLRHPNLYVQQLHGISLALAELDMNLQMILIEPGMPLPWALRHGEFSGVLLAASECYDELAELLKDVPTVEITSHALGDTDYILPGNEAIGVSVARHFAEQGHKRVVFLNPVPSYQVWTCRGNAFVHAAKDAGMGAETLSCEGGAGDEVVMIDEIELDQLVPLLRPLVDQYVAMSPRPTGMLLPVDIVTSMVYPMLRRRGVEPGRDVTVVSIGNEQSYLSGLDPRPASIDIGPELLGRRAVEQLVWSMLRPGEGRTFQLSLEPLIIPSVSYESLERGPLDRGG
ncbi:substrate-binding domain-containing protein [Poriferisphaera sp. WC338]|uniref:substrate-binding domain-containing protein n=1 Tax=Poriferisphaera sp. WC338 TaxID=3425129 RepID=UPI003D819324